jgi:predicted acyltransferase
MPSTLPNVAAQPESATAASPSASSRLMSLDLFRGATIAGMILVNNAGSEPNSYWPLKHSQWNGWTPTDLVFPFFLFIVGVAMTFSFSSRLPWACF